MVERAVGIATAALAFLTALVRVAPEHGDVTSSWLPQLETVGRTILFYEYLSRTAAFLFGTVAVLAVGYRAGARLDLSSRYRRFTLTLGIAGAVGQLAFFVVYPTVVLGGSPAAPGAPTAVAWLGWTVGTGVHFAVVGFAGAAFAQFSTGLEGDGAVARSNGNGGVPPDAVE